MGCDGTGCDGTGCDGTGCDGTGVMARGVITLTVLPSHDACSDTCNDTCIALSGRVQRHLYFDLLGRLAWSLLASVAGIAAHHYDTVF
jgi:hypothetical protein